jgi:transglutaminase-like putative cysteine protease
MTLMCNQFKLAVLGLFLAVINVSAQTTSTPNNTFKFGKVSAGDFETRVKGVDSAAAAIKIFDVGKGSFEISTKNGQFVYNFTRHVRYKVVNKNGYDLADFEIGLYNSSTSSSEETLQSVRAATYNLVDGKVEVSKMTGEAKFSNRVDKNHVVKKFTLPNVKEGSIIEYTYNTISDFTFALDDWYFQSDYPCKYSEFTLTLPQYYLYKISATGYIKVNQSKAEQIAQTYFIPGSVTSSTRPVNATATRTVFFAEDIPAIKDESYITTIKDYTAKLSFELTATNFPSTGYKDFSSTWPKLINELMEEESFGRFIKRTNYDKGFLTSIVKDEKDSLQKVSQIFNFVKNNIKWDGKYGYYSHESSQRAVFQKRAGNTADINLSLLGLLKSAGIKCSPVLLSTRENGVHPGFPMLSKFNNVIVMAEVGNERLLLDATDEDNLAGLISYHDLSHQGLSVDVDNNSAQWVSLDNSRVSKSTITYNLVLSEDNKFSGNLYLSSNNYVGLRRRSLYKRTSSETEFIKDYKTSKPGLEVASYKIEYLNQPEQALAETMEVIIEDNVEDAGNLLYFSPLFFERTKENPFALEERKFPVDFAYPLEENVSSIIEFPAKYQLEKLPKNEAFALPEKAGFFSIAYFVDGNKIAIKTKISINKPVFSAEEYFDLKELFKNIVRKQAEQIVFKKI